MPPALPFRAVPQAAPPTATVAPRHCETRRSRPLRHRCTRRPRKRWLPAPARGSVRDRADACRMPAEVAATIDGHRAEEDALPGARFHARIMRSTVHSGKGCCDGNDRATVLTAARIAHGISPAGIRAEMWTLTRVPPRRGTRIKQLRNVPSPVSVLHDDLAAHERMQPADIVIPTRLIEAQADARIGVHWLRMKPQRRANNTMRHVVLVHPGHCRA